MAFFIFSNPFAIIEFDIHETIFIFWRSKSILQKYYFGGGQKFMRFSYNECSLVFLKKYSRIKQDLLNRNQGFWICYPKNTAD